MTLLAHVAATLISWYGWGLDLSLSFSCVGEPSTEVAGYPRYPQADWPETGSDVSCMLDPGSAFVALQVALADVVSVFSHALTDATQEGRDVFCDISKRMEAYSSL